MDWQRWHDDYDRPDSRLHRRLEAVRHRIRLALDAAPAGPLRAISLCAGQGRDLLPVLAVHPRREDVTARLVELDPQNVAAAAEAARAAGLHGVEVVAGDASLTDRYAGMVPADLVLVCGVFGNISVADIERTVDHAAQFCAQGATLVWTRGRDTPDQFPLVCERLESRGFAREWISDADAGFGVGVHRFTGTPLPLDPGSRMFTFVGYDVLRAGTAGP
ncbi:SAM-dependent methyltransferase [Streptomyces sp. NPDC050738]|uniref:SAM-dependent methyltransferase n=1 Tax=Streptomyces sp. NPDC050738 TaxID=3154744 RepID=UPI00343EAB26